MTRAELLAIIEGEGEAATKADKILAGFPDAGKIDALQAEIDGLKEGAAKAVETAEAYNQSLETIEGLKSELKSVRIDWALDSALTGAKVKNAKTADLIKAAINLDKARVLKDGSVSGIADQIEALKADEQTAFLFGVETDEQAEVKPEPKRQAYEPAAGDTPEPPSFGKMFAEMEMDNPTLNSTFDSAMMD